VCLECVCVAPLECVAETGFVPNLGLKRIGRPCCRQLQDGSLSSPAPTRGLAFTLQPRYDLSVPVLRSWPLVLPPTSRILAALRADLPQLDIRGAPAFSDAFAFAQLVTSGLFGSVILACRDPTRGNDAVKQIGSVPVVPDAGLARRNRAVLIEIARVAAATASSCLSASATQPRMLHSGISSTKGRSCSHSRALRELRVVCTRG
jgi:hypothetical protein